MNKEEILNYLAVQQSRTKEVTRLEKEFNQKSKKYLLAKKQWNIAIVVLVILGIFAGGFEAGDNWLGRFFVIIAVALAVIKFRKISTSSQEFKMTEQQLKKEMSKSEYLEGLEEFPVKFYDYDSIYRLYSLVKENRVTTLQEAYTLLENQLNTEYQNHLAEQNLLVAQATERNARITAVTTALTAYNTSKK